MSESFSEKEKKIKNLFLKANILEEKYQVLIDLGKKQKKITDKTNCILVPGCQSEMWLKTSYVEGLLYFETESDALISSGIGQLLCML